VLDLPAAVELLQKLGFGEGVDRGADQVRLLKLPVGAVIGMELAGLRSMEEDVRPHPAIFTGAPGGEEGLDVGEAQWG
jgi:hypothetical protein